MLRRTWAHSLITTLKVVAEETKTCSQFNKKKKKKGIEI